MSLHGVDVSGYQADWRPASGDAFVFIKATEGRTVHNRALDDQTKLARAASMQVGFYHFLHPGNATAQAAYFVSQAPIQQGDLLVCDWEKPSGADHASVADAANFIAEVKRLRPDNKVGLYCNKSDWLGTAVKKGDFFWLAHYTSQTDVKGWDFWQYSDKPIDQNHAASQFTTLEDLKAWATGEPNEPPPADPLLFWSDTWNVHYLAFGGNSKWVTPTDKEILVACSRASGWGSIRIVQGGRRPKTSYSGTTHMGLGVGDIGIDGRNRAAVWKLAAAMRRSGMGPFPRGYGGDPWANEKHIHWGSYESRDHASKSLQGQLDELRRGGDGLVGGGKYNGPSAKLERWKTSAYNPANYKVDTGQYRVIADKVNGRDIDGNIVRQRTKGYIVQASLEVTRFDRQNIATKTPTYYGREFLEPVV